MLHKTISLVLLFLLSNSCNFKKEPNLIQSIPKKQWENINELYGNWTKLERDSIGYLHYKPCDGKTPGIQISKDSIILTQQIETPTSFEMKSFDIKKNSIIIHARSNNVDADFIFKIVTSTDNYILFKWKYLGYKNNGKKIITRENLATDFRQIENPCDLEKVSEMMFLPVDYN